MAYKMEALYVNDVPMIILSAAQIAGNLICRLLESLRIHYRKDNEIDWKTYLTIKPQKFQNGDTLRE